MRNLIILILFFIPILGFNQSVRIKGYVLNSENNHPMFSAEVSFDSISRTIVNEEGYFELIVPKKVLKHKLKVTFIGCFTINFIHLPNNEDEIELGKIPMFEYVPSYDMSHFNCSPKDAECKKKKKAHKFTEKKRIQDYYFAANKSIMSYNYIFKGKSYHIDSKTGNIDLKCK